MIRPQSTEYVLALQKPLGYIDQSTFPLPTLHATLRGLSRELHQGHGFFVLRNLPIATHNRADNIAIYAGVASHIAPLRGRQDSHYKGQPADMVLNHVKDLSATSELSTVGSPAYTSDAQVFHTDSGDIVSLLCLSEAADGGTSRLASTWRVYNELAATRPDLVHTLTAPWPFENFGKGGAVTPQEKCSLRPLMYYQPATSSSNKANPSQQQQPDRILLQYARRYFTGFGALPRSADVPPLSEAQAEALDALHFLGKRFSVGLEFRAGDAQFVNNLACFHARDAFRDDEGQRRHLVRLWLRDPEFAWDTPHELREKWEGLYTGIRPEREVFPLEPTVRAESKGGS